MMMYLSLIPLALLAVGIWRMFWTPAETRAIVQDAISSIKRRLQKIKQHFETQPKKDEVSQ